MLGVILGAALCLDPIMTDAALAEENLHLRDRLAETEAAPGAAPVPERRLERSVGQLFRKNSGASSGTHDPYQFNLPLEC